MAMQKAKLQCMKMPRLGIFDHCMPTIWTLNSNSFGVRVSEVPSHHLFHDCYGSTDSAVFSKLGEENKLNQSRCYFSLRSEINAEIYQLKWENRVKNRLIFGSMSYIVTGIKYKQPGPLKLYNLQPIHVKNILLLWIIILYMYWIYFLL